MQLVVHYHEIALKGKNRDMFVKRLIANLRKAFQDIGRIAVRSLFGRIVFRVDCEDLEEIDRRMSGVFGVANYSAVREIEQNFDAIAQAAWEVCRESGAKTFVVRCSRPDKSFPMRSLDVEREVGAYVLKCASAERYPLRVSLKEAEMTVRIEIVNRMALVSGAKRLGPGGLPVGTGGRLVGMLSSGFDSPVACWNMMKRGAEVVMCHFHSYPFTNRASLDNCIRIAEILTRYQFRSRLYLVGFAPVQEELLSLTPADMRMILYRRSMVRIAEKIARRVGAEALVTGESLGQVASQTLTNLAVIDDACHLPMLRPLIGADKEEIMTKARQIGTYETSSLPYEDCCSLMLSQHPVTRAELDSVLRIEHALKLEELEERVIGEAEVLQLSWHGNGECARKTLQEPNYGEADNYVNLGSCACSLD
ncbi:tRNA 4-thiouridine(8) synthase ThiI [bacterium]|nr:tRNA 4-thiouridine(8) synthase ThiI [bacterium]